MNVRQRYHKLLTNMPLHKRQDQVAAHLSPELKKVVGKRSVRVKRGYTVKVVRGSHKGKEGKVSQVKLKSRKIYIEGVSRQKSDGTEVPVPIDPSNVIIVSIEQEGAKK